MDLCKRLIVSFGTLDVELLLAVRNLPASLHPMLIWPKNIARFRRGKVSRVEGAARVCVCVCYVPPATFADERMKR